MSRWRQTTVAAWRLLLLAITYMSVASHHCFASAQEQRWRYCYARAAKSRYCQEILELRARSVRQEMLRIETTLKRCRCCSLRRCCGTSGLLPYSSAGLSPPLPREPPSAIVAI